MSTAISTTLTQVPAHIAARIALRQNTGQRSAIAAAVVGDGGLGGPRISIKSGRYRLVEDGVETVVGITLDVIIVGANPRVSKVFYAGAYDPNAVDARPACFSHDGIKPDASIVQPVSSNCTSCMHNVLGSKMLPSGAKSKMCADQRHLAVVPAQDPSKVYNITVPVSGMTAMRNYIKELENFGVVPEEAVTELGFDPSASFPKMTFTHKGYVPEKAVARVDALANSDEAKIATRVIDPRQAAGLPAPASKPALTSAPAPAAVAVDEAYAEEAQAAAPAAAPAVQTKPETKPETKPVTASDELAAKIDSLFS